MKAAFFYGGKDIRVEEVPDMTPGPGEVLVRVLAAGVCGSDLHGYRDANFYRSLGVELPFMTGHELAGEVAALGPDVKNLVIGQRVGVEPRHLVGCGECHWCRRGDYHICPWRGQVDGKKVQSTGFSEYSLEPADKCYPLPDDVSIEEAAIMDVYAVAVHAVHRVPAGPTEKVAVIGLGPIGLATVQVAKAAGATQVIGLGTRDNMLELATRIGCDNVVNVNKDDPVAAVRELTDGQGADVIYESVGGKSSTFQLAIDLAAQGAHVGIIGLYAEPQELDSTVCMRKELSLDWANSYALWNGISEYKIALDMLINGKYEVAPLITHRFPLDQIDQAFAAADDKLTSGAVKVLVTP